jgi:chromosome partitioning protein
MQEQQPDTHAQIVVVTNEKGGVGKTTLAMHIAAGLHEIGKRPLLIDADPQNSLMTWVSQGEGDIPFPVANLAGAGKNIAKEIKKYVGTYDYIVIDGRPTVENDVIGLLLIIADLVLIPLKPSAMDFQSTLTLLGEVGKAQNFNPDLKSALVLNQAEARRILARETQNAIHERNLTLLNTRVAPRECYPQSYAYGTTVFNMGDRASKQAAAEISALVEEVCALLQGD